MFESTLVDSCMRVLVVDDCEDDRLLIQEMARGFTFRVELKLVGTLEEARRVHAMGGFDVALVDLGLGVTEGIRSLEVAKEVLEGVALVIMTGDETDSLVTESLWSGAQDFLIKGRFNTIELEKAIRFAQGRFRRTIELERKTEELDFMLDTQHIGLLMLDDTGKVRHCNHAICDILEIEEDWLLRRHSPLPIPERGEGEVRYGTQSGRSKLLEVRSTKTNRKGRIEKMVTVLDVTSRREMELRVAESEKYETVARVCYGVAHEFNNLLAMTRTKTDFLETLCQVDPVWAAHIGDLKLACDRGAGLVRKLMTFYGREKGNRLVEESVEVGTFLRSVEDHLDQLGGAEHSVSLTLPREECFVEIPETDLLKVVASLTQNACDAMPEGGEVRIGVSLVVPTPNASDEECDKPSMVCISVIDTGMGISDSVQRRIFEPFFTTKGAQAGQGLGLSVVRNLLREHGGEIQFESFEGKGSEFRVLLNTCERPIGEASDQADSVVGEQLQLVDRGYGVNVLVVDDESIIRFSVARLLERVGCVVTCAENASVALEYLEDLSLPFEVLLTDINMPGMNGVELSTRAAYLREDIRIVLMSGYGSQKLDPEWMRAKRAHFLAKPFDKDNLRAIVLGEKRAIT